MVNILMENFCFWTINVGGDKFGAGYLGTKLRMLPICVLLLSYSSSHQMALRATQTQNRP